MNKVETLFKNEFDTRSEIMIYWTEIRLKFTFYLNIHINYFVLHTVLGPADVKMNKP